MPVKSVPSSGVFCVLIVLPCRAQAQTEAGLELKRQVESAIASGAKVFDVPSGVYRLEEPITIDSTEVRSTPLSLLTIKLNTPYRILLEVAYVLVMCGSTRSVQNCSKQMMCVCLLGKRKSSQSFFRRPETVPSGPKPFLQS